MVPRPFSRGGLFRYLRVSRWGYATVGAASGSAASIVRYGTAPGEGAGAGLPGQRLAPFIGHIRDYGLGALLCEPAHGRGAEDDSAAGDDRRSFGKVQKNSQRI